MAEELDFSELNSTMAELKNMLVSLGPALFQLRGSTLGGAEEIDRLGQASRQAADAVIGVAKEAPKTKEEDIESRKEKAKERKKRREINEALEPYRKEVKYSTDGVKQGQRAQRDLTAALRGFGSNIFTDIMLGAQRYQQSKNLIAQEQVKLDLIAAEIPIAQEAAQNAQQKLADHKTEMASLADAVQARQSEADQAQEGVAAAKEYVDTVRYQTALAKSHIATLEDEIAAGDEDLAAKAAERDAAKSRVEALHEQVRDMHEDHPLRDEYESRLREAMDEEARLTGEYRSLSESLAAKRAQVVETQSELAKLEETAAGAAEALAEAESTADAASKALQNAQIAADDADQKLDALQQAADDAADKVEGLATSADDAAANLRNMKIEKFSSVLSMGTNALSKVGGTLASLGNGLRDFERRVGISAQALGKMAFTEPSKAINIVKGKWMEMIGARGQDYFDRMIEARDVFGDEFGGTLTGAAASKLASQARNMGVTVQELAKARRGFMDQSGGNLKGAVDAQNKFVAEFKKKGLNTKDAFQAVMQYSDIMARNGGRFAASFAKAAADAKKIGVDLKKVDAFGDSIISDYEGFLEKQSELGAMGFSFDSSKMAEVAESGDTGALMNELRSQLAAQGKDLTKMRRSEQLALSNAFGIPMEELLRLSQPKPEEGSKQDKMSASGEKTAMHAERIDKATLNQNTKLTAIGMLLQKIAGGAQFLAPIATTLFAWISSKRAEKGVAGLAAALKGGAEGGAPGAGPTSVVAKLTGGGGGPGGAGGAAGGAAGPMGKLTPSLGEKMAGFGQGIAGLGKGAGDAVGGFMKGLASGIAAFGNPAVVYGAGVLIGTIAVGLVFIGGALALAMYLIGKAMPTFTKGLQGFNEIDGTNLLKVGAGFLGAGAGLSLFGTAMIAIGVGAPLILAGSFALGVAGGVLLGMAKVASMVLPDFVKALVGFNEVDGFNLAKVGLSLLPLSLGIFALGPALASLGIGTVVDKIANMFSDDKGGIAGVVEKIKKFSEFRLDPSAIKGNADSLVAFARGMTALKSLGGGGIITDTIGEALDKIAKADLTPVLASMRKFAEEKVGNPAQLKAKAEAFKVFGEAMAAISEVATGGWMSDDLTDKLKKWPKAEAFTDVFTSYTAFSDVKVAGAESLKSKAEAFLAFGNAMEAIANIATGGWMSDDLTDKLKKWPPPEAFQPLYNSYIDFSKQQVGKADELKNKADAFKAYGEAIKTISDIASGGVFSDDLSEKLAIWAAVDIKPLYTKFQEFSALAVGDVAAIEGKAKGLTAFSEAMSSIKEVPQIDPTAMQNITTGFANFITATSTAVPAKITATATGLNALTEAFSKYASGPIGQAQTATKNFGTALDTIGTALTKVGTALASIQTSKIDKIKDAFSPQFTAAFTASIMALSNIYQGKKVDAGAITRGSDVVSNSGYGERTLVTPSGPIALHNSDTVVAYANDMVASDGVQLLSKGALLNNQPSNPNVNVSVDMSRLEQKLDAVVRAIGSMNVQMDGAKVGKVLVNAAEAGGQIGIFGQQSRATL